MIEEIKTLTEFRERVEKEDAVLAYFSTEACKVCKVLKPKIHDLLIRNFPKMKFFYVGSDKTPDISAQYMIFAAPTIIIFFEGQETIRKSRHISLTELEKDIERYYNLFFE